MIYVYTRNNDDSNGSMSICSIFYVDINQVTIVTMDSSFARSKKYLSGVSEASASPPPFLDLRTVNHDDP